jgi:hypothetical protein
MAKKRISNGDLCWLISEELDLGKQQTRTSLAVVPDNSLGWRVIVSNRHRGWTAADEVRLEEIQGRLRVTYELRR